MRVALKVALMELYLVAWLERLLAVWKVFPSAEYWDLQRAVLKVFLTVARKEQMTVEQSVDKKGTLTVESTAFLLAVWSESLTVALRG